MSLLFLFDMDDVVYDYRWRERMAGLTQLTGLDMHELRRRWWVSGGEERAEAGEPADPDEYLAAATAAIGTSIPRDEWVRIRAEATYPRPGVIAAVSRASELGRAALLTNNGILIHHHLHEVAPELVPVMGREHMHASAFFGARKPEPLVYRRAMEHYGARPESTFFVDDRPENIEGAASCGITAHLFVDEGSLLAAIESFASRAVASERAPA